MAKEKRKSTTVCWAAALILGCYLVQTTDCLRLTKTEKRAARSQSNVASKTVVQEGSIVFGKVSEKGLQVTDETTKSSSNASVEDAASYQADFAGWTQPDIDDADKDKWNRMATSLHCFKDYMKFRSLGPGASQISVEQANQPPMPLSMVPSKCGYKMQGNSMGFVMMVPYNGCNMVQRGDSYMLPLRWHGNPVSLMCPKRARKFYNYWPQDYQVPKDTQASQYPQIPQYPQMPKDTQVPQAPQYPQVLPQYPQVPPVPQAPQYPQVPPVPQAPQYPQVPPVPQAPQYPQVPNDPQETQDLQNQYLSYLYSYPFFSYLISLAAEQSTNSPNYPSYPQLPFSYPVVTTTEPPTTSAPKVPSFPQEPFNSYFPWPLGQHPDFPPFFPLPIPEYQNPAPDSSQNPTPGYQEYPSPTPGYAQYPSNPMHEYSKYPTLDVMTTSTPATTQSPPAAPPQFYPPEYQPFQNIPYWLFPFQG